MLEKLTVENFLQKITKWFTKDRKMVFLTTFIIGMLVHFQVYANELLAYDGYWHYGSFLAKGWEVSLGRFFIPFVDLLRGTVVTSSLTSIIAISITAFTAITLIDVLKVQKRYIKILIGILLAVTPTFSLTLMYTYTADSYAFAMLFSVLSVYFLNQNRNRKTILLAMISIIVTLGFYQAYLCVIVTLCVITYLVSLYTDKEISFKKMAKKILQDVGILLVGVIAYYLCYMLMVNVLHLSMTDYNGGNKVLSMETLQNLLPAIKNTYITFYQFHFTNAIIENTQFVGRNLIDLGLLLLIIINTVVLIVKHKNYKRLAFASLMLIAFPIFTGIIEVIAQATPINLLMSSALYLPIILLLKQLEIMKNSKFNNILNLASMAVIFLTLWIFVLTDNATYTATNLYNKQMTAVGNRIIQKLEETEGITPQMPICVAGKMEFNLQNPRLTKLTNFDVSNVNTWTWQVFLQDNLGIGRNICDYEDYRPILEKEEYKKMPIFPQEESIQIIDGIVVIKVGNN